MNHPSRYQQLVANARAAIKEMTPQQLVELMEQSDDFYLVDVRETHEWQKSHLPNAVHLSRGVLEPSIERYIPDPQAQIVLYCGGGGRSALAALSLKNMGYENISSLAGGFGQWCEAGYPVVVSE